MEKIINLTSRYGENNYLKLLSKPDGSESKTYQLKTTSPFIRAGDVEGGKFIDPSGGPMIVEGHTLLEANAKVKSIDYVAGSGYIITFE